MGAKLDDSIATPLAVLARSAWQTVLTAGLCSIALGVLILAWPHQTLRVVGVLFGIYLLVSGILQVIVAFAIHVQTAARVLSFVGGALSIMLGLICFRGFDQSIVLLALWIGFGWLFRGVTLVALAVSEPGMPARGWQMFLGLITVLGGILLVVEPLRSVSALTLLAGWWLLAVGVVEVCIAFSLRGSARAAEHAV